MSLRDGAWFVRSNGGRGSYPVTRQGWLVVAAYVVAIALLAAVAVWLAIAAMLTVLWIAVFGVGMAIVAFIFIRIAQKRTDHSVTYNEYRKRNA